MLKLVTKSVSFLAVSDWNGVNFEDDIELGSWYIRK